MRESVIVSAARLPTGKFLGALKSLPATDLGARVIREAVTRAGIDADTVDECIMGNVVSAGLGQAPARQAALGGGLSDHVGALTINKVCGSGLKAVMLAAQGIATGDIDVAVAGGMESMSNCPVPAADRPGRHADGKRRGRGLDGSRWPLVLTRAMAHGPRGRGGRREIRRHQGGSGRVSPHTAIRRPRTRSASAGSRTRFCRSRSPNGRAIRFGWSMTNRFVPTRQRRRWPNSDRPSRKRVR